MIFSSVRIKQYLNDVITNQRKGILAVVVKVILFFLSFFYGVLVSLRGLLYDLKIFQSRQLPKPVISVGNLVMGGVGKTPLIKYIAQTLVDEGHQPAILMRGYMAENSKDQNFISDEVLMLREQLPRVPVIEGSNRYHNALKHLKDSQTDVFLLDDGYQHRSIKKDLEILALNARAPWGNGFLIPRGQLRELKGQIKRADIIVLTKADKAKAFHDQLRAKLDSSIPVLKTEHVPVSILNMRNQKICELSQLKNKDVCLLSSIGDPQSFHEMVLSLGAQIKCRFSYLDHYLYKSDDVHRINQACQKQDVGMIVTTHKDAVKLKNLISEFHENLSVYMLNIRFQINQGKDQFFERIHNLL